MAECIFLHMATLWPFNHKNSGNSKVQSLTDNVPQLQSMQSDALFNHNTITDDKINTQTSMLIKMPCKNLFICVSHIEIEPNFV